MNFDYENSFFFTTKMYKIGVFHLWKYSRSSVKICFL